MCHLTVDINYDMCVTSISLQLFIHGRTLCLTNAVVTVRRSSLGSPFKSIPSRSNKNGLVDFRLVLLTSSAIRQSRISSSLRYVTNENISGSRIHYLLRLQNCVSVEYFENKFPYDRVLQSSCSKYYCHHSNFICMQFIVQSYS